MIVTGRAAVLILLPVLAACTPPLDNCVRQATGDLRAVQADIARTAGNIDRGYAIHRQVVRTPQIGICGGFGQHRGPIGIQVSGCRGPDYTRLETPVPVDIAAERQKLAALRERELALRAQSQPGVAACYARYQG